MSSRPSLALALVLVLSQTGCIGGGSSPEPTYYALAPANGLAQPGAPRVVELRRPALAGYLDRSDIVGRVADYRLRMASEARWGEPLGAMIGRVLAEDLGQRLPGSTVFTEAAAIAAEPDALVDVDVQRFEAGDDGTVTLLAQVAVEPGRGQAATTARTISLAAKPPAGGTSSLVATMSALLGQLADRVAALLRQAPAAPTAAASR